MSADRVAAINPPIDDTDPIRLNSVSTPGATRTGKNQQNSLQKGSRYGISVSTPHRRYGHRLRTPFLRTPFPRLLFWDREKSADSNRPALKSQPIPEWERNFGLWPQIQIAAGLNPLRFENRKPLFTGDLNSSNRKPAGRIRRIRAARRPQIAESPATRPLSRAVQWPIVLTRQVCRKIGKDPHPHTFSFTKKTVET